MILLKCVHSTNIDVVIGKVYKRIHDISGELSGFVRIIDESNEDFFYPKHWFVENSDDEGRTVHLSQG